MILHTMLLKITSNMATGGRSPGVDKRGGKSQDYKKNYEPACKRENFNRSRKSRKRLEPVKRGYRKFR